MPPLTDEQCLNRLFDEIGESIKNASDEEILEDARIEGRDPAVTAQKLKSMLRQTLKQWEEKNAMR